MAFVYILECGDGTYYIGSTKRLEQRLREHQSGKGGRYTRSHQPVKLVYVEEYETFREAYRREFFLKTLTHARKKLLIENASKP